MLRKFLLIGSTVLAVLLLPNVAAEAVLMELDSVSGNQFRYKLTSTPQAIMSVGDTITLTGLGGVTNATDLCFCTDVQSFTSNSVTWVITAGGTFSLIFPGDVFSSSTALDNIPFSTSGFTFADGSNADMTGTVLGPVAFQAPEPATFGLFGIGLAGLGLAARRRRTH